MPNTQPKRFMPDNHFRRCDRAGTGHSVDAYGDLAHDPTKNVLDLVEASVRRIDDLQTEHNKHSVTIQAAEVKRIDSLAALRAEYQEKLAIAESKRIDAIRAVDVGAVAIASERAGQQAQVLANQVAASAETLRALVASTAQQVATSLSQVQLQLTDRIALLEKSQYESKGRGSVAEPLQTDFMGEMRKLRDLVTLKTGQGAGMSSMWGYILAAVTALSAGIAIVLSLQGAFRPNAPPEKAPVVQNMSAEELALLRDTLLKTRDR